MDATDVVFPITIDPMLTSSIWSYAGTGQSVNAGRNVITVSGLTNLNGFYSIFRQAPQVWVDFAWTGTESGTQSEPFNTLNEGTYTATTGGVVKIKGNTADSTTGETPRLTRAVRIEAVSGTVRIGVLGGGSPSQLGAGASDGSDPSDRSEAMVRLLRSLKSALAKPGVRQTADASAVREGTTHEPVLPYTQATDGSQAAQADSVLAVRLRAEAGIDPATIFAPVNAATGDVQVEWRPVQEGDTRDLWVIVRPQERPAIRGPRSDRANSRRGILAAFRTRQGFRVYTRATRQGCRVYTRTTRRGCRVYGRGRDDGGAGEHHRKRGQSRLAR